MTRIPDKVDLVIPVKTRESINERFLERAYEEIPVNKLIIMEGGALSTARAKAYYEITTEWFVFLDDDVLIGKGWWKTITSHIDDETGAIGGMIDLVHPYLGPYAQTVFMLRDPSKLGRTVINNCLMRKECLKDYNPPAIFWGEDQILYKYVTKKWKWKKVRVNGYHFGKIKDMTQLGYVYNKFKLYPKRWIIRRFFQIPIMAFLLGVRTHSLKAALWLANHHHKFIVGWLKALCS